MIRETEKRLLPGAACAVLFVHGILGSPAQFAPFLPLVPQDWSFCNLLLQGHGGGARDFSAASMAVWREQTRQAFAELRAQHETVVIAAHSMGTLFAVQEAVRSPVEGLFLLNVPLHGARPAPCAAQCVAGTTAARRETRGGRRRLRPMAWSGTAMCCTMSAGRRAFLSCSVRSAGRGRSCGSSPCPAGHIFRNGRACLRAERAGVCGESAGRRHDAPALRARLLRSAGGPAAAAVRLPCHAAGM